MLNDVKQIDENIAAAEARIAADSQRVAEWKRKRESLVAGLTDEERQQLNPPAEPAPAPPTQSNSEQSSS